MTVTERSIEVAFVNTKSKYPKFSSGSLKLADETWLTVSKDVDVHVFKKGQIYKVEIETNEQGYESVIRVIEGVAAKAPAATTSTGNKPRDFDAEARGKSRFGLFAAALQSPALARMEFKTTEEYIELVKKVADAGLIYTFEGK